MLTALVPLCTIGTADCRNIAESPDQTELPFIALHTAWKKAPGARRQVRQGGVCPQERAPDDRVVAAWSAFLIFMGAGAFAVGMAIHNETHANHLVPQSRERSIYYCATGEEMLLYEPARK
jgi:hypothetical protein